MPFQILKLTQEDVKAGFDKQVAYHLTHDFAPNDSVAIALGRTTGLAMQMGCFETAKATWAKLFELEPKDPKAPDLRLPSLDDLYTGFQANVAAGVFDRFGSAGEYPATAGLAFSNAMGSLAHMIDYLRRKDVALAGGEEFRIMEVGPAALVAMGFEKEAELCKAANVGSPWISRRGSGDHRSSTAI